MYNLCTLNSFLDHTLEIISLVTKRFYLPNLGDTNRVCQNGNPMGGTKSMDPIFEIESLCGKHNSYQGMIRKPHMVIIKKKSDQEGVKWEQVCNTYLKTAIPFKWQHTFFSQRMLGTAAAGLKAQLDWSVTEKDWHTS